MCVCVCLCVFHFPFFVCGKLFHLFYFTKTPKTASGLEKNCTFGKMDPDSNRKKNNYDTLDGFPIFGDIYEIYSSVLRWGIRYE